MTAFNSGKSAHIYFINHACSTEFFLLLYKDLKKHPVQQHYKHCLIWKAHKYDWIHTTQTALLKGGFTHLFITT